MKNKANRNIRLRAALVGIAFLLCLSLVGAKAVYLQVFRGDWLSRKAADQYETSLVSYGKRGSIYDARQRAVAVSIEVTSIAAYPARITDTGATARALAGALDQKVGPLRHKLSSERPFVWIKRQASPKEADAVRSLELPGIDFIPEYSRFYPQKTAAAQLIGFTGIDGHGLEGLEFFYDRELQGPVRRFKVLKDAYGRGFDSEKAAAPDENGRNLQLTIDLKLQDITESALEKAVNEFGAVSGMAVVMAPRSGALLALAHYPLFNPNTFTAYNREQWRNRAVTDPFEPGSTMKIFSAASAIESGKCTPNTIFFCENGTYAIGPNVVHDTKPQGWLSLQQIVKFSSNIGAVKVGELLGPETLYQTLRAFGFGAKTQLDCPGETAGSLASYRQWTRIDAGAIAFGQGIAVSAVQLAAGAAAIANDGILMQPYVVRAITTAEGRPLKTFGPRPVRRVISADSARTLRRIMATVTTEGGTGIEAALEGYAVGGKTGTAQKIDRNGTYAKNKFVSSFIGFAPVETPELVILVVIDEPSKQHYGGTVAAPVFRTIANDALNYLNVTPAPPKDRLTASQPGEAVG